MKMIMTDLCSLLCKLIFSAWSLSPLLALTTDGNYGLNSDKLKENNTYRLSVLNLRLGFVTYYVGTCKLNKSGKETGVKRKFLPKVSDCQLFAKITLENCQWNIDNNTAEYDRVLHHKIIETKQKGLLTQYSKQYINDLQSKKDKGKNEHKEFLCYLIDNERQRKNTATTKINIYVTALVVIIPLNWSLATQTILYDNIMARVALILYFIIIVITIFQSIKISSISRSTFLDLRQAAEPKKQLIYNYYYDWQSEKYSTQQAIGKLKVIEEYFMCTIVLILVIMALMPFSKIDDNDIILAYDVSINKVYTINFDDLEDPFSEGSIQYVNLHSYIIQSKPDYVVIFCNETDRSRVLDKFEKYEQVVG